MEGFSHACPIVIEHIFISPGHNYLGRPKDGPGRHVTRDVVEAEARAGLGLVGDRYFGVPAHYDAQITFVSAEVFDEVRQVYGDHLSPILTRRNVVVRHAPLNPLIGHPFVIDFGADSILFEGAQHCAPCAWMDAQLGDGARRLLAGRGGLRARILEDGFLHKGPATLRTQFPLDSALIVAPVDRPNLP